MLFVISMLTLQYIETLLFQREKRLQASLRKHRRRIHIEEVDNSSDEEESKDNAVPCSKKVPLGLPLGY